MSGWDPVLVEVLRLLSETVVGAVTAAKIEKISDLSSEEVKAEVLKALFQDVPFQNSGMLHFGREGIVVDLPVFLGILEALRTHEAARISA